jgi:hypothetical protein
VFCSSFFADWIVIFRFLKSEIFAFMQASEIQNHPTLKAQSLLLYVFD